MLENDQAITCEMLVEGYTVADATKEIGEHVLALLERPLPQIKTVELDQIESAQHRGVVMLAKTEEIEDRQALPIDDDRLAIDDAGPHRQGDNCASNLRETGSEIIAVPGEQPDAVALAPSHDPKAIVFDFVNPADACRRCSSRSGKAGLKRDGTLNTAPLEARRHALGIDGRTTSVERLYALASKGESNALSRFGEFTQM